jgi:hypothetical protein
MAARSTGSNTSPTSNTGSKPITTQVRQIRLLSNAFPP